LHEGAAQLVGFNDLSAEFAQKSGDGAFAAAQAAGEAYTKHLGRSSPSAEEGIQIMPMDSAPFQSKYRGSSRIAVEWRRDGRDGAMTGLNPRITVEAGKMGGKPCIRGLRFTVYDLASYLASGMNEEQILSEFPDLEKEDFPAVYEFFASIPERIAVLEAAR
jgi:uncharacterized protein (DUF433 family)